MQNKELKHLINVFFSEYITLSILKPEIFFQILYAFNKTYFHK